jgi:hypothetical protein
MDLRLAGAVVVVASSAACGSSSGSATGGDGGFGADSGIVSADDAGGGADGEGTSPGDGGSEHDAGSLGEAGHEGGSAAPGLHVVMGSGGAPGHIVDGAGQMVTLHGADRSGTEYSCLSGSFFDGPVDQNAVDAMKNWHVNAVRVPLNEDCWLNINGVPSGYGGPPYQAAIKTWVTLLENNGMYVILDLHWTAPGTTKASGQLPMADADHSPTFWSQVATAYGNDPSVIFDLFNEPFITDWTCWQQGGMCAQANGATYQVAGMASLLQAVRKAGAKNVVILGGLSYSSDMSQWVTQVQGIPKLAAPLDGIPIDDVAASWHAYDFNSEQSDCPSQYNGYSMSLTCGTAQATAMATSATSVLAGGFPLVIGETGISAYSAMTAMPFTSQQVMDLQTWFDGLLTWAEGQGQGYLAWSWNTDTPPVLITDYTGAPSPYFGETYQAHLQKF